jgi:site-specific DNA-methyltransferase (adenine-specific)
MAVAIEDAGFEIRDQIQWIYGSGFPKSLDVSKAMDKQAGAERTEYYKKSIAYPDSDCWSTPNKNSKGNNIGFDTQGTGSRKDMDGSGNMIVTLPATDLAKQWQGWGTALKPAHEPAVLARKPLTGTVADNVTAWGVGAINVDGTRIEINPNIDDPRLGGRGSWNPTKPQDGITVSLPRTTLESSPLGRWPANVIFDEEAAQVLDGQSGYSVSTDTPQNRKAIDTFFKGKKPMNTSGYSDSGGASRFFYVAKASKAEREAGLYYEEWHDAGSYEGRADGSLGAKTTPRANHHPTVKPIALMRYLVRMVTPKGGIVLDPFTGSGSTGCAAVLEGCDFVGMDITPEYVEIAQKRIAYYAVESPLLL